MADAPKDPLTSQLRVAILEDVTEAQETDRAEISLVELSFVSRTHPNRHAWINSQMPTEAGTVISVDLEDWNYHETWDNTVMTIDATTIQPIVEAIRAWLSGASTSEIGAKTAGRA